MTASADHLIVPTRFRGPPESGNGGYVAGLVAALVQGGDVHTRGTSERAVEVTLLRPPPLETVLDRRRTDEGVEVFDGTDVVARGRFVDDDPADVDPVDLSDAATASSGFAGHRYHPFPSCFSCGTGREDGLGIFPGPVAPAADGSPRVAAAWTPHADLAANFHAYDDPTPRVAPEVAWAALDCVGGWATELEDRLAVLGQMTAILDDLPAVDEPHVVVGQLVSAEGRKARTVSTLFDADGRIVGRARHTWLAVDPSTFGIQPRQGER